jgi:IS30 family transposase
LIKTGDIIPLIEKVNSTLTCLRGRHKFFKCASVSCYFKCYDVYGDTSFFKEVVMADYKHLNLSQRIIIEHSLNGRLSFKAIGRDLKKSCTTISKEVKNRRNFKKIGAYGRAFNDCIHRFTCTFSGCCDNPACRNTFCKFCAHCHKVCTEYKKENCTLLASPPYVCNGCKKRKNCTLEKAIYSALDAQKEYELIRSESRQGIQISEEEALRLNAIISPLVAKGQSPHAICVNHMDELMCDERTIYNYIDNGILSVRNIDLPRKVRYSIRKPKKDSFKVDKHCRIGRTYDDFGLYMMEHPDTPITQMDSVEGRKGGKVLLSIHFTIPQLMLAYLRDANTSQSVIDVFNRLYLELRREVFITLFPLLLGDNGSEFSNPLALERDKQGNQRTKVFYCDPSAPYQKGAAENNHELIRRVIPKGTSLDYFIQDDITKMMNHINCYPRKNLGDKTPYEVFSTLYGADTLKKLGISFIPPDEVTLRPSLLKK